jgi:hypothetical protein
MATDRGLAHPGGRRPLDGEGGHELGLKLVAQAVRSQQCR